MNIFTNPIKYKKEIVLQVNLNDVVEDVHFYKHCGFVSRNYVVDTPYFEDTFDETINKIIIPKSPYLDSTVSFTFNRSTFIQTFNCIERRESFTNNNYSEFFYYIERAIQHVR